MQPLRDIRQLAAHRRGRINDRAKSLTAGAYEHWRDTGRQGDRPTFGDAKTYASNEYAMGANRPSGWRHGIRTDAGNAYMGGGYSAYTPGMDIPTFARENRQPRGDVMRDLRSLAPSMAPAAQAAAPAAAPAPAPAAPQEEAPKSMWRRDADPSTLNPFYRTADLTNLVPRDRWLQAIGADYGMAEGAYVAPGSFSGFSPDDLPSWVEYYQLLDTDRRFR